MLKIYLQFALNVDPRALKLIFIFLTNRIGRNIFCNPKPLAISSLTKGPSFFPDGNLNKASPLVTHSHTHTQTSIKSLY